MKTNSLDAKGPYWSHAGELSVHQLLDEILALTYEDPRRVRQLVAQLLGHLEKLLAPGPKQMSPELADARQRYLAPLKSFKEAADRPDLTMPELVSLTKWLKQKIAPVSALVALMESIAEEPKINEKFPGSTPPDREIVRKLGFKIKWALHQKQQSPEASQANETSPASVQPPSAALAEPLLQASSIGAPESQIADEQRGISTVSKPAQPIGLPPANGAALSTQAADSPSALHPGSSATAPSVMAGKLGAESCKMSPIQPAAMTFGREDQPIPPFPVGKPAVKILPAGTGQVSLVLPAGQSVKGLSMAEARALGLV